MFTKRLNRNTFRSDAPWWYGFLLLAAIVLAGVLAPLAPSLTFSILLLGLGLVVLTLILFAHLRLRLYYALALLIISACISRETFGLPIETDLLPTLFLLLWVALELRGGLLEVRHYPLIVPILAYLSTNFFSTILNSPVLFDSLYQTAVLSYRAGMYFLVIMVVRRYPDLRNRYPRLLQIIMVVEVVISTVVLLLGIRVPLLQSREGGAGGGASIRGTFQESNLLGIFVLCVTAQLLTLMVFRYPRGVNIKSLSVLAVGGVGLLLGYTRSTWLGFILVVVLLGVITFMPAGRRARGSYFAIAVGLVTTLGIMLFGLAIYATLAPSTSLGASLWNRLGMIGEANSSVTGRLMVWQSVLDVWRAHPWLGGGPLSFQVVAEQTLNREGGWLYSFALQTLHDSGIIGLVALLGVYGGALIYPWRAYRAAQDSYDKGIVLGYVLGQIGLYFASLFSSFTYSAFAWIYLGLSVGHSMIILERSRRSYVWQPPEAVQAAPAEG